MKYRMLNPFKTKDGVLHAKGDVVDLNDDEAKIGLSFRAIETVSNVTKETSAPPVQQEQAQTVTSSQTQPAESTPKADDAK